MAIDYTSLYASAKAEMLELEGERSRLAQASADCDKKIAALSQMINAMAPLVGEEPTEAPIGMTDFIRTILMTTDEPLSATDIRNRLGERGFDLSSYSNAMAAIHTVLKRLTEAQEVQTTHAMHQGRGGKRFRGWGRASKWERRKGSSTFALETTLTFPTPLRRGLS